MSAAAAAPVYKADPELEASAKDFVSFVNASPSQYHAVGECERRLVGAGFTKLSEREPWSGQIKPGGLYYVTRNQSAVVAFAVGAKYKAGDPFSIAAAHTDSPCLRVKPHSALKKSGFLSVGVECYGGGLWYSWLDRDLGLAGRVIVAKEDGTFESRLVRIDKPILRIPSLAIHLDRTVNTDGLKLNPETHLAPVLATETKIKSQAEGILNAAPSASASAAGTGSALTRHHPALVAAVASSLGVPAGSILDFDLALFDTHPSTLGGLLNEFIFSARLDNLMMTYTALQGLINSVPAHALADDSSVRVFASFDHEECGSSSVPGAASTLLEEALKRVSLSSHSSASAAPSHDELFAVALRKSILVSADMAHGWHPNYPSLHEENHRPLLHAGIVIKANANQRYATTPVTAFLFRKLAEEAGVPLQSFVNRQDMGCGSTIGPIVATRLGLRTVDVGIPQLSMHSCREMAGADDCGHAVKFFAHFYGRFPAVDASLSGSD